MAYCLLELRWSSGLPLAVTANTNEPGTYKDRFDPECEDLRARHCMVPKEDAVAG